MIDLISSSEIRGGFFCLRKWRLLSVAVGIAAGLGAGIAAIFRAPLAGGILSGEIFYKHEFEADALILGFIASTVSYSIVGFMTGWQSIFSASLHPTGYTHRKALPLYAPFEVLCAAFAHLLFCVLHGTRHLFQVGRAAHT